MMRHAFLVETHNHSGELLRVIGMVSGRGMEVESVSSTHGLEPNTSRVVIHANGSEKAAARMVQQLATQVRVIRAELVSPERYVKRELALIGVHAPPVQARQEVISLANLFHAEIIDASATTITIQLAGETSKIDSLIDLLRPLGLTDLARTGQVVVERALTTAAKATATTEAAPEITN